MLVWPALALAFWIWMLVDCARNDPERNSWLWILFFFNLPAAVVYFLARYLPRRRGDSRLPLPTPLRGWSRRQDIERAESVARTVGTPHQFVLLGQLYEEVGRTTDAVQAFSRALEKEPTNREALWGLAESALESGEPQLAQKTLEVLLEAEPDYKFGEGSLAYGRALLLQGKKEAARTHMTEHLRKWTHPPASILLAHILIGLGEKDEAREELEKAIERIRTGPEFFKRNHRPVQRQAEKMLRSIKA